MADDHDGYLPARVRIGNQLGQVRWFRSLPRAGEWVSHAPDGLTRDEYEVDWVMHWAWDPEHPEDQRPEVSVEICLAENE